MFRIDIVNPLRKMNSARVQMLLVLIAAGFCLASAETVVTDKPNTFVDHSNGVEVSIPGTTEPRIPTRPQAHQQAQPHPQPQPQPQPQPRPQPELQPQPQPQPQDVSSFVYNHNGNVALSNGAGSIFTRPDGRTVLQGFGGQTIVTDGDDSDEDDTSGPNNYNGRNNVFINGGGFNSHSFHSSNGGSVLINSGGEGSVQNYNNYQLRALNGGLELTVAGKVYKFVPKAAGANEKETVEINGQQATVQYENGNIIVELADGTVLAKADNGLFSGDRQSFVNRKQIQEDAQRQAAHAQEMAQHLQHQIQDQIARQMQDLQEELQRNLGNIGNLGNIRF